MVKASRQKALAGATALLCSLSLTLATSQGWMPDPAMTGEGRNCESEGVDLSVPGLYRSPVRAR
jgi:hypothetical protein